MKIETIEIRQLFAEETMELFSLADPDAEGAKQVTLGIHDDPANWGEREIAPPPEAPAQ